MNDCVRCGLTGHIAGQCTVPRAVRTQEFRVPSPGLCCYRCGNESHYSQDCDMAPAFGWPPVGTSSYCFRCGSIGHQAVQCNLPCLTRTSRYSVPHRGPLATTRETPDASGPICTPAPEQDPFPHHVSQDARDGLCKQNMQINREKNELHRQVDSVHTLLITAQDENARPLA
jgi:hypothetical protein